MKFSFNFVKDFVSLDCSAQVLAEKLTMAGLEVGGIKKRGNDYCLEAEVTSNRYDWLSILGIAYEAAAVCGKKVKTNALKISLPKEKFTDLFVEDKKACPLYYGALVDDIKIGPSPKWLSQRLLACEINPINNVVDITNYLLLKWGQPLHAFDYNTLCKGIYVRKARKGEKIITIDQKERILDKEDVIIADASKPIALAGIMGGKETEISFATKKVFLETAIFNPVLVRRTSRRQGISTDSSYRFERYVYPEYTFLAFKEALVLFKQLAKAKVVSWVRTGGVSTDKTASIKFSLDSLKDCLGYEINKQKTKKILSSLGIGIKRETKTELQVSVPGYRKDLKIKEDIFEEIARINGYDEIPAKVSDYQKKTNSSLYEFKKVLREKSLRLGFQEAITFSLVSPSEQEVFCNVPAVEITNPLRQEESVLRNNISLGMVKVLQYNIFQKETNLSFFEIGNVFSLGNNKNIEKPIICFGASGKEEMEIFMFKAKIEGFLKNLGITADFENITDNNFKGKINIIVNKTIIGFIGIASSQVRKKLSLCEEIFIAEIDINLLFKNFQKPFYKKLSAFPAAERDISFSLRKEGVTYKEIENLLKKELPDIYERSEIIDIYKGNHIGRDCLGITLRVFYRSNEKTLTSEEVDNVHNRLRQIISEHSAVSLR